MRQQERLSCSGSSLFEWASLGKGCGAVPPALGAGPCPPPLHPSWKMLSVPGKEAAFRGKLPRARDAQLCGSVRACCCALTCTGTPRAARG